jgi:phosphatidylinositol phospholipase C, delta
MPRKDEEVKLPLRAGGGGESAAKAEQIHVPFKAEHATEKHLRAIYGQHSIDEVFQDGQKFDTEDAFFAYMRSTRASAMAPPTNNDLNQPLSAYFISSSHNTYLVGHQLYGNATTAGYTNVLERGCRCLEIDIWDGDETDTSASSSDEEAPPRVSSSTTKRSRWSKMKAKAKVIRSVSPQREHHQTSDKSSGGTSTTQGGALAPPNADGQVTFKPEPQVVHGYTLTAAVPFREVCAAIKKSAFVATDLPLIVSLETHAGLQQQETMVEIMKDLWGEYLVDSSTIGEKGCERLPSPESLRGKILVKVKQAGINKNDLEMVKSNSTNDSASSQQTGSKPSKMLPALSDLGLFTRAFSFKGWDQPEAKLPAHVFSLTDSKAHGMLSDPVHGDALFRHNLTYLTRIYPKGTRISSSNYDPACHWRHGAQMVALNWQKLDTGMMLNEAMFAGYDGWVLKPNGFRTPDQGGAASEAPGSKAPPPVAEKTMELKVQLFSGENLPPPPQKDAIHAAKIKPYVQ